MPDSATDTPNFDGLVAAAVEALYDPQKLARLQKVLVNAISQASVTAEGAIFKAEREFIKDSAWLLEGAEQLVGVIVKPLAILMVTHLLGIEVTDELLRKGLAGGAGTSVGEAVARVFWSGMQPAQSTIEPGDENALKFMSMISQLTVNGWYEGLIAEETVEAIPGLAGARAFSELANELIDHLGLNRLMRVALKPLVDETIATPLRWKVNTLYRPSKLGASAIVRQIARGRWDREQGFADLQQQGYSDDRIEALLNEAARFLSLDQAMLMVRRGAWTEDQVIGDLQHQGYDESIARLIITTYREARLMAIRDDIISAARTAYAARDLEEPQFRKLLSEVIPDKDELAEQMIVGGTLRELRKNRLNHSEVKDAVKAGILSFRDYRLWLDKERYHPDDALTLELLLHYDLNKQADLVKARAAILAERLQAAAGRLAAAQQRKADVDAARALHRRGALADLDRAAVRGLIDFARVEEVLRADYDEDTVAILVGLLEDDRQVYLAQQQAAADAAQRAAARHIDIGALDAAVLEGVLSLEEFRSRLAFLKFAAEDVNLLTATLGAKLDDRVRAQLTRDQAAGRAAQKTIDLSRLEQLVRRGVRPMADYAALLSALEYDAGAVAGMVELLQLRIADDQAARDARTATAPADVPKALSLEQLRRAVLLGVATANQYQTFLVDQGWTADAQIVLMAELRDDVASADAARHKRAQTGAADGSPRLSVSRLARAARLGLLAPAVYQQALVDAGYTADDVALEMDLLVTEIADVQAARAKRDALAAASTDRGLSLDQVHAAVLKGVATIDEYRARAAQLGYATADINTLIAVLGQELAGEVDATARRADVAATLKTAGITLDELDAAVRAGQSTLATYAMNLERLGVAPVDAALLAALLSGELTAAATAAA